MPPPFQLWPPRDIGFRCLNCLVNRDGISGGARCRRDTSRILLLLQDYPQQIPIPSALLSNPLIGTLTAKPITRPPQVQDRQTRDTGACSFVEPSLAQYGFCGTVPNHAKGGIMLIL